MQKLAVYGLPLNPTHLLNQLEGKSFCVSFATRDKLGKQLNQAIELVGDDQILLVDNGAFTYWRQGGDTRSPEYLNAFEAWAQDILDRCPQAIAVIPDVIDGNEEQNAELIYACNLDLGRCMPIWHMHESLGYLIWLASNFRYVGIGSSAQYAKTGTPEWHARIQEAFAAIDAWEATDPNNLRPRIHMMRAQAEAHKYPFDSSDSTNVAVNHNRFCKRHRATVRDFAEKVDAKIQASAGRAAPHQIVFSLPVANWAGAVSLQSNYQPERSTS